VLPISHSWPDLTTAVRAVDAAVHSLDLLLELLDDGVALLEILVEPVSLGNELLFPLSEPLLFDLDLLRKPLAERLLLFLEFGVVQLAGTCLAELASLHLLCAVGLVVVLLGGVDQVEHVCADQDSAKALEVAVVLVLNLGNTPGVLATLDGAAVARLDILLGANDGEWHGSDEAAGVLETWLIVLLEWWLVDLDALGVNDGTYLVILAVVPYEKLEIATHSLLELGKI
jgi:hypothetical protein